MQARELRDKYLNFFEARGHKALPSAPLVPENDPTVLFTTAGMHPLVPFLLGERHPSGTRLTNCQKCFRTGDIEEVGDDSHLTFFEMLGNWSLGDYFKKEAIKWSWEFLTTELGLDPKHLAVSCFAGDEDAPRDEEAAQLWREVSGSALEGRIDFLPKENNWWGPAGETGPCGPDTEIFVWVGESEPPAQIQPGDLGRDGTGWMEIWNNVFMEYHKTADGKYEPLAQKNVDTGMGLERVITFLQGQKSVYDTDQFAPLMRTVRELARENNPRAERIVADHIRAAMMILSDGVLPSNVGQGYVLRRLIRLAVRQGKQLGMEGRWTRQVGQAVVDMLGEIYPELKKAEVLEELAREEEVFAKTLNDGMKQFTKMMPNLQKNPKKEIAGRVAFKLYDTYGFPVELTEQLAKENDMTVDRAGFEEEYKKHQEKSRTASAGAFKGGLQDGGETTARLHTATHLLLAALKRVLGPEVHQRGSNITAERLRFDFAWEEKLTDEQKQEITKLVNTWIQAELPITQCEMSLEEARSAGAEAQFTEKYGEVVKVYTVGQKGEAHASCEVCGGPHATNTGELGVFKIKKEEASSRGVRRIKAVLLPKD